MKYQVDGWNNFCRVFELPEKFSGEFCFGGGIPTMIMMVDWFNPVPELPQPAIPKEEWEKKTGNPIKMIEVTEEEISKKLIPFLNEKEYTIKGRKYLIICNFELTFMFTAE